MRKLLALGFIILTTINSFAQTSFMVPASYLDTLKAVLIEKVLQDLTVQDNTEIFRKNIIKVNLSSFVLYNNSLSYERSLSRKITFVAGYRYMPETTATSAFLAQEAIDRYGNGDKDFERDANSTIIGNNTFTGEVRFYSGKYAGARGFYLSLYGRYMDVTASVPSVFETDTRYYPLNYEGTLKGIAGGAMIGAQWLIAKRVTLDWYILGGHYGKLKVDMPAVADLSTMTPTEKNALEYDIESINVELSGLPAIEANATDQGVSVSGTAPYLGVRGLGFSLGIAF